MPYQSPRQLGLQASLSQGRMTPRQNAEAFLKRGFDWLGMPDSRGTATRVMSFDPLTASYDAAQETTGGILQRNPYKVASGALAGLLSVIPFARGAKAIRAYHGSPHDFDRFDASKIGTGEGAQAYGHGLYFAENPEVARSYKMAGPASDSAVNEINFRLSAIARERDELRRIGFWKGDPGYADRRAKDLELAQQYDDLMGKRSNLGRMYEVDINASPEQFLDWDKPLWKQGEVGQTAQGVMRLRGLNEPARMYRDPQGVAALSEAGIPGIKYFDQGSRGGGEGTRNYVVFNPGIVDIVRKYMTPLALGLGSAGAAYQAQQRPMQ